MNSTRSINIFLNKVKPTNTLLIGPMPCEKQAANILNKTVESMDQEKIGDVAYLKMKSTRGRNSICSEIFLWTLVLCMNGIGLYQAEEETRTREAMELSFTTFIAIGNILPNVFNAIRYNKTKNACERWLSERIGAEKLTYLNGLSIFDYDKLATFLHQENIKDSILLYSDPRCSVKKPAS